MVRYKTGTRMKKRCFSVHMSSIHPSIHPSCMVCAGSLWPHSYGAVGGCWLHSWAVASPLDDDDDDAPACCCCCCCCCRNIMALNCSVICNRERDGQPTSTEIHYVVQCCCHAAACCCTTTVVVVVVVIISNDTHHHE